VECDAQWQEECAQGCGGHRDYGFWCSPELLDAVYGGQKWPLES
jgi:hypothetical protein